MAMGFFDQYLTEQSIDAGVNRLKVRFGPVQNLDLDQTSGHFSKPDRSTVECGQTP